MSPFLLAGVLEYAMREPLIIIAAMYGLIGLFTLVNSLIERPASAFSWRRDKSLRYPPSRWRLPLFILLCLLAWPAVAWRKRRGWD